MQDKHIILLSSDIFQDTFYLLIDVPLPPLAMILNLASIIKTNNISITTDNYNPGLVTIVNIMLTLE